MPAYLATAETSSTVAIQPSIQTDISPYRYSHISVPHNPSFRTPTHPHRHLATPSRQPVFISPHQHPRKHISKWTCRTPTLNQDQPAVPAAPPAPVVQRPNPSSPQPWPQRWSERTPGPLCPNGRKADGATSAALAALGVATRNGSFRGRSRRSGR